MGDKDIATLSKKIRLKGAVCVLSLAVAFCGAADRTPAQVKQQLARDRNPRQDIGNLTLEELMEIDVTSVSKKEEKLFQTAAAVYVITQEEIRRSGMTSIPELLRVVPGLDVARFEAGRYAISARGFNGRFANKLLVLIDGRSVYSPETSGVYWEVQDLPLEDIERIEVIRGPGGSLWGANAVNGVINIITKRAQDTQGGSVTAEGGSEGGFTSVRYGSKVGDNAHYRAYTKFLDRRSLFDESGHDANHGQAALQGGGRVDWQVAGRDSVTVEGHIFHTHLRETSLGVSPANPFAPQSNTFGQYTDSNVMGRWVRTFSERSDMALQLYVNRFSRDTNDLPARINTFDVDFQHHLAIRKRQELVWGLGYRTVSDNTDTTNASVTQFHPKAKRGQLFSAFAQDEIILIEERVRLQLGAKIEHNAFSGFEIQPSIRMLWTPTASQTVWGAVSRAVRTPARFQRDSRTNFQAFPLPDGTPTILAVVGSPNTGSELLRAYELGYRVQPHKALSFDAAAFYNTYDSLTSFEPGLPLFEADPLPPHLVVPIYYNDLLKGTTYGMEVSASLAVSSRLKFQGSYSFLSMHFRLEPGSIDTISVPTEGDSPRHQFQLHSYLNLPRNFELDAAAYHVSRLVNPGVPSYTRLDLRLGWRPSESLELSGGFQNLLHASQPEFRGSDIFVVPGRVKAGAYGKLSWRF